MLAVVTKENGAPPVHHNGDAFEKYLPIPWGQVLCALMVEEERVYVSWRGTFCLVSREDVELMPVPETAYPTAAVIPEGDRPDAAVRSFQQPDPAARPAAEWPAGTEVILLDREGDFCLAEGLGCRGWILGDRLAPDGAGR